MVEGSRRMRVRLRAMVLERSGEVFMEGGNEIQRMKMFCCRGNARESNKAGKIENKSAKLMKEELVGRRALQYSFTGQS